MKTLTPSIQPTPNHVPGVPIFSDYGTPINQSFDSSLSFKFTDSDDRVLAKSLASRVASLGGVTAGAAVGGGAIAIGSCIFEEAQAAPDPNVQAVVQTITDTIPLLTGIAMLVLSAGLAPWAARTCLSWLSSILKGAL